MEDGSMLPGGWASEAGGIERAYLSIDPSALTVGKKLGEGTFGIVYQATWSQPGGMNREVAVKQLKNAVNLDAMMDFMKVSATVIITHPHPGML